MPFLYLVPPLSGHLEGGRAESPPGADVARVLQDPLVGLAVAEVGVDAQLVRAEAVRGLARRGEDGDRQVPEFRSGTDPGEELEAVQARELEVEDDAIRQRDVPPGEPPFRFFPV